MKRKIIRNYLKIENIIKFIKDNLKNMNEKYKIYIRISSSIRCFHKSLKANHRNFAKIGNQLRTKYPNSFLSITR
jgi:hypothetical protein